jgi:hypothetical protein
VPEAREGREVVCTDELATAGMVAHRGDDETTRAGEVTGWLGWRKRTEAQGSNWAGERVMVRRRGGGDQRRSRR